MVDTLVDDMPVVGRMQVVGSLVLVLVDTLVDILVALVVVANGFGPPSSRIYD